jgi:uncharacterized protein YegP (UPF0339 family)
MYHFEITHDRDGYRARFYSSANGKLMWWTEGYERRADADHAVWVMQTYAASSPLR